jgi:hypothetical protein
LFYGNVILARRIQFDGERLWVLNGQRTGHLPSGGASEPQGSVPAIVSAPRIGRQPDGHGIASRAKEGEYVTLGYARRTVFRIAKPGVYRHLFRGGRLGLLGCLIEGFHRPVPASRNSYVIAVTGKRVDSEIDPINIALS